MVDGVYHDMGGIKNPASEKMTLCFANKMLYEMGSDDVKQLINSLGKDVVLTPHNFTDRYFRPGDQAFDILQSYQGIVLVITEHLILVVLHRGRTMLTLKHVTG
ncbi:MAG: hypothetical protein CM15mP117_20460 [Alphaproteobacteria bacterium]|nr:MAG: hypothetical protein CM15mP117_20460 [Alphaproteobacteria bacterium]